MGILDTAKKAVAKAQKKAAKKKVSTNKKKNTSQFSSNVLTRKEELLKQIEKDIDQSEVKKKNKEKVDKLKTQVEDAIGKVETKRRHIADFETNLEKSGLKDSVSYSDKVLGQRNPTAGNAILQAKREYNAATTQEAKDRAHQKAEEIRNKYGNYSGGAAGDKTDVSSVLSQQRPWELREMPDTVGRELSNTQKKLDQVNSQLANYANPSSLRLATVTGIESEEALRARQNSLQSRENYLLRKQWETFDNRYQSLRRNDDFAEVVKNAKPYEKNKAAASYLNMMADDEKDIYKYILETEGNEAALKYVMHITDKANNEKRMDTTRQQYQEEAKKNPVKASVSSILESPLKGVSAVGQAIDYIGDGRIDEDAWYNRFTQIPSAQREGVNSVVEKKWGKTGSFLYSVGMSMGDFLLSAGISPQGATYILGSEVAPEVVISAKERGLTDDQAVALGTVAGLAAVVTEKFSIDALFNKGIFKNMAKRSIGYLGKNVATEAGEEGVEEIINTAADVLVTGDKSAIMQNYNNYQKQGMSPEEAAKQTAIDFVAQLGLAMAGGALAGGTLAAGSISINKLGDAIAKRSSGGELNESARKEAKELKNLAKGTSTGPAEKENAKTIKPNATGNSEEAQTQGEKKTVLPKADAEVKAQAEENSSDETKPAEEEKVKEGQTNTKGETLLDQVESTIAETEERVKTKAEPQAQTETEVKAQAEERAPEESEAKVETKAPESIVKPAQTSMLNTASEAVNASKLKTAAEVNTNTKAETNTQVNAAEEISSQKTYDQKMQKLYEKRDAGEISEEEFDEIADIIMGEDDIETGNAKFMSRINDEEPEAIDNSKQYSLENESENTSSIKGYGAPFNLKTAMQKDMDERLNAINERKGKAIDYRFYATKSGLNDSKVKKNVIRQFARNETRKEIEDITGLKIHTYFGNKYDNGHLDTKNNTVHLNVNGTRSVERTIGHELLHLLRNKTEKAYREIYDFINNYYPSYFSDNSINKVIDNYAKYGKTLDKNQAVEELMADFIGNYIINNKSTFKEVVKTDRSFAQKVIDWLNGIFASLGNRNSQVAKFISEARDMCIQALTGEEVDTSLNENANYPYPLNEDVTMLDEGVAIMNSLEPFMVRDKSKIIKDLKTVKDSDGERMFDDGSIYKWLKDTLSVASMVYENRDLLDYEADESKSSIKPNSDKNYGITGDLSTLCTKRSPFQGTLNAILKRRPDILLLSEDVIYLRNLLKENGVDAPCHICFVESRRRNLGKFALQWRENYKGTYVPDYWELMSTDGLEQLKKNHLRAYEDFVSAMNGKGTSSPKLIQTRTNYRGEVASFSKARVNKLNRSGGFRLQSNSDFEIYHAIDLIEMLLDMTVKRLKSQAYSKVPEFGLIFGPSGIKINLSLIPSGKGIDENGKLVFDPVEGMDFDTALKIRDMYSENVGTVCVGISDDHIKALWADPRIDFVIPFHKSGWGEAELESLKISHYDDYTDQQEEKWLDPKRKSEPYVSTEDYWDYEKSGKENAELYLKYCSENGIRPVFSKFLVDNGDGSYSLQEDGSTDGYWKCLSDFKMYDNNGNAAPQRVVTPEFNMEELKKAYANVTENTSSKLPHDEKTVKEFIEYYDSVSHSKEINEILDTYNKDQAKKYTDRDVSYFEDVAEYKKALESGDKTEIKKAEKKLMGYVKWLENRNQRAGLDTKLDSYENLKSKGYQKGYKANDIITYDDEGNIIPPSQRLDYDNPDVRYSIEDIEEFYEDYEGPDISTLYRKAIGSQTAEDFINNESEFYKPLQEGIADKDNFMWNTIAVFKQRKSRPSRKPDYVSYSRYDGKVSSEYWYSDKGVIRGSDHWGLGVASCDWPLKTSEGKLVTGSFEKNRVSKTNKIYGFCNWGDFTQKTMNVYDKRWNVVGQTSFDNTEHKGIVKLNGKYYEYDKFDEWGEFTPKSGTVRRGKYVGTDGWMLNDFDYQYYMQNEDYEGLQKVINKKADYKFSDSKIRDENGELIPVYHGSYDDFNEFDISKSRKDGDIQGFYFSPMEIEAKGYGPNLRTFFLNIKNPADERTAMKAWEKFKGQSERGVKTREYLEEQGYDGVNISDEEYIAFRPEQIKSAEPIIYDDYGDVIMPFERFDGGINDVRYSYEAQTEEDDRYLKAVNDGNLALASQIVEEAAKRAMEDGATFELIDDNGITYDDEGKIIPPSQRFNVDYDDVRYSIEPDTPVADNPFVFYDELPESAQKHATRSTRDSYRSIVNTFNVPPGRKQTVHNRIKKLQASWFENGGKLPEEEIRDVVNKIVPAMDVEHNAEVDAYLRQETRVRIEDAIAEWARAELYGSKPIEEVIQASQKGEFTMDELKYRWQVLKDAQRLVARVSSTSMLSVDDKLKASMILRGQYDPALLDKRFNNVNDITRLVYAKREREQAAAFIKSYNVARKQKLDDFAEGILVRAGQTKDKRNGLAYARETLERNFIDVFGKSTGNELIQAYAVPMHKAVRKAMEFVQQESDKVRAMDIGRKPTGRNEMSEAYVIQALGEARSNIKIMEQSHGIIEWREGKTLAEWRKMVQDIQELNPDMDFNKIDFCIKAFQKMYDRYFELMNEVRIRNGYEPVNYHKGYFPHFQSDDTGLFNAFSKALGIKMDVQALPTQINGMTHLFRPGITYFKNANERLGFETSYDVIEGFDSYIRGVSDVIYMTDIIQKFRSLSRQIRYRTTSEAVKQRVSELRARTDLTEVEKDRLIDDELENAAFELSGFVAWLDNYTNLLANKRHKWDRSIEDMVGRNFYNVVKAMESRIGANMIVPNVGSWLTNYIPLTQGWALLGSQNLMKGMFDTVTNTFNQDGLKELSDFLYTRSGTDPLIMTKGEKLANKVATPMKWIDEFVAGSLVRGRYYQNLKRGYSEAESIEDADMFARSVMAGRTKGAMPTLFEAKNPFVKYFAQFQLEVNNEMSYLFKDMPREAAEKGKFAILIAAMKFCLGAWLYNELYKFFIGRTPALDPIGTLDQAIENFTGWTLPDLEDVVELIKNKEKLSKNIFKGDKMEDTGDAIWDVADRVLSQVPVIGGALKGFLGMETGGRYPIATILPSASDIQELVSSQNSGAYKFNILRKDLIKTASYTLPPFGGGQVKKIVETLLGWKEGGSYSITKDGEKMLQYPLVTGNTKLKRAGQLAYSAIFGKTSLPLAREWIANDFDALDVSYTETYWLMVNEFGENEEKAFKALKQIRDIEFDEGIDITDKLETYINTIDKMKLSDAGKLGLYMAKVAKDDEREALMECIDLGADIAPLYQLTRDIYIAKVGYTGSDKSSVIKELIDASTLAEDQKLALKRQYGSSTYESTVDKYSGILSEDDAIRLADALAMLPVRSGRSEVWDADKYMAVIDLGFDIETQMKVLTEMFKYDSYVKKMNYGYKELGVTPEMYVRALASKPNLVKSDGTKMQLSDKFGDKTYMLAAKYVGKQMGLSSSQISNLYKTLNYSIPKDEEVEAQWDYTVEGFKGTPNFTLDEIRSGDGELVITEPLIQQAKYIQELRDWYGSELPVNSWYRSIAHNRAVGGARDSYHTKGMATDIGWPSQNMSRQEKIDWQNKMEEKWREITGGTGGVGRYRWGIHLDSRNAVSNWGSVDYKG